MTVTELIELLKTFPPNREIRFWDFRYTGNEGEPCFSEFTEDDIQDGYEYSQNPPCVVVGHYC